MPYDSDDTQRRYRREQLSFDVELHPHAQHLKDEDRLRLAASVRGKLDLPVHVNLNHGDRLVITVADADGNVLTSTHAAVKAPPTFEPIESKDLGLLGYDRVHKFEPTEGLGI